jgi:hypothetical protein
MGVIATRDCRSFHFSAIPIQNLSDEGRKPVIERTESWLDAAAMSAGRAMGSHSSGVACCLNCLL